MPIRVGPMLLVRESEAEIAEVLVSGNGSGSSSGDGSGSTTTNPAAFGEGTSSAPYVITSAEQFNNIALDQNLMDKDFCLANDIDMASVNGGVDHNVIGVDMSGTAAKLSSF